MNNHLDKRVVLRRIAEKIIARVERMGFVQAVGVHAVCRCGGVVMIKKQTEKWVN